MVYIKVMKSRKRRVMDAVRSFLLSRWFTAMVLAFAVFITVFAMTWVDGKDALECAFLAFMGWLFSWMAYMVLTE